jgi:hypothetical protein
MARSTMADFLQDYAFWLMDVGPVSGLAIPIFAPLSGFASISSPEISIEQETIVEGNWYFKSKVIKRAEVTSIVLRRGATFSNSDFWRWTRAALTGQSQLSGSSLGVTVGGDTPRRQLILIQFLPRQPIPRNSAFTGAQSGNVAAAVASALPGLVSGDLSAAGTFSSAFSGDDGSRQRFRRNQFRPSNSSEGLASKWLPSCPV